VLDQQIVSVLPVRNSGPLEGLLEYFGLILRPVENPDVGEGKRLARVVSDPLTVEGEEGRPADHFLDGLDHELGLGLRGGCLVKLNRLTLRALRLQGSAGKETVRPDHPQGPLDDRPDGAVVAVQFNDGGPWVVLLELPEVSEIASPEPVDGLVGIPDHTELAARRSERSN